ncbi:MAG TPA: anhydro-N-acetylmuramic acid kinase [Terriglobia bacterium]|nr:anhydro-N-acetylmuramic acid kinase [Terriglobia bacterium]
MTKTKGSDKRFAVGLISGTSMDGVDAALVVIRGSAELPRVKLLAFYTQPYPAWLQRRLLAIAGGASTTAAELSRLNTLLGGLFGDAAARVCGEARFRTSRLDVVGSHGQTVFHFGGLPSSIVEAGSWSVDTALVPELQAVRDDEPPPNVEYLGKPSTLQIADPAVIAEMIGAPVVADFRAADTAAGGEGAPLVPMVDYLVLRDSREGRVALNIGGIANVTVIPPAGKPEQVFGFDTGPGNMVMDSLIRGNTEGRKSFDADGRVAAMGEVLPPVLKEAMAHPFFSRRPPKSAGREQFGAEFIRKYFLQRRRGNFQDLLRTALELTARTIANAIEKFVAPRAKVHRLIVSGGGAHNLVLLRRIAELLPQMVVETSDRYGLPVDAKEAIAFALLADRTMHGLPGNLPAVTGARRAVVLGKISKP